MQFGSVFEPPPEVQMGMDFPFPGYALNEVLGIAEDLRRFRASSERLQGHYLAARILQCVHLQFAPPPMPPFAPAGSPVKPLLTPAAAPHGGAFC